MSLVLDYCNKANGDHRSPLTNVKTMKRYETLLKLPRCDRDTK